MQIILINIKLCNEPHNNTMFRMAILAKLKRDFKALIAPYDLIIIELIKLFEKYAYPAS